MDGTTSAAGVGNDTTLRLALGMRGGVSLAVWIGGAAAELDDLRRAQSTRNAAYYDRLLAVGRYDSVEIDVMSGASAGGLNAVLAACAMVGAHEVAGMRQTWLDVASLRDLLESTTGDDESRRSLLGGDFFTTHIHDRVVALLDQPALAPGEPPARLGHRLDVFLSGTVLNGLSVPIAEDPYSVDAAKRSGAFFHFRHFAHDPAVSDIVSDGAADRLAKAARTTASFPGAFEPVRYQPGEMPGVFLLPGVPDGDIDVLDGGVIDNIPVARAISGVPNIPSRTATDRWILYLQPSPDAITPKQPQRDPGRAPSIRGVVLGIVGAFMSESILDDIEVLRRHNAAATEASREWTVAVSALLADPQSAVVTNTIVDAGRIVALLIDPARELIWRPLHKAVPPGPLAGRSGVDQTQFRADLERRIEGCDRVVRPFAPIARSAALLIRWARAVEAALLRGNSANDRDRDLVGSIKLTSYQLMHLAQLLTANQDWQTLTDPAEIEPATVLDTMYYAAATLDADTEIAELVDDLPIGRIGLPAATNVPAHRALLLRLHACEHLPKHNGSTAATATSVQQRMWSRLAVQAQRLAELSAACPDGPDPMFSTLAAAISARGCDPAGLLIAIDQRTVAVHHGVACGIADPLKYLRLAGSNVSPLCIGPEQLPHNGPRFSTDQLVLAPPETMLAAKHKLAGSDLSNFSAFISQRWRANDWMWGRLDAAKSLVDLVTSPERLSQEPAKAFAAIEAAMLSPLHVDEMSPPSWVAELNVAVEDLWARHAETVRGELAVAAHECEPERLRVTKQLLVLRRHWEILANELPVVAAASLRPVPPKPVAPDAVQAAAPDTLVGAVGDYERSPRSFGQVWGTRWLTALGIRSAFAFWAATRPPPGWRRWARAPLKPLPMTFLGVALARNRGLLAMALAWNFVLVPRLYNVGAWFTIAVGMAFAAAFWWMYRARDSDGRPIPYERFGRLYVAGTVLTFVAAIVIIASGDLRDWLYGDRFIAPDADSFSEYMSGYTVMAAAAAAVTTWLLWSWALGLWRIASALFVAFVTGAWTVFGRMVPDPDAGWFERFILRFDGIAWALFIAVWLTTTVAHFAFMRRWPIAEYDAD